MQYFKNKLFLIGCFILWNCQSTTQSDKKQQKEFFANNIQYAQWFKVSKEGKIKKVTVFYKTSQTKDSIQYYLIPRGTAIPKHIPPKQIIQTPIRSIVPLSHTFIACLNQLGVSEKIVGVSEVAYLPDQQLLQKIKTKKVLDIGMSVGLNEELILALKPDVLMTNSSLETSKYTALNQSTTKIILNSDWLENTPLGQAEWLKFVALFFEEEAKAEKIFQTIVTHYLKIQSLTQKVSSKPTVLVNLPYKDVWYVPSGESYMAQLIQDAGGVYLWKSQKGSGSIPLDIETVYSKALKADFWINLGLARTKAEILGQDKRLGDFKAFQTNQLFNYNLKSTPTGGNEYLMNGIITPHLVLADLVKILHPDLLPQHQWEYYQKLP